MARWKYQSSHPIRLFHHMPLPGLGGLLGEGEDLIDSNRDHCGVLGHIDARVWMAERQALNIAIHSGLPALRPLTRLLSASTSRLLRGVGACGRSYEILIHHGASAGYHMGLMKGLPL